MSVIGIFGLPGTGKTLFATYLMKKKYKKENRSLLPFKKKVNYNNIFSNYPIQLTNNFKSIKKEKRFIIKYKKRFGKLPINDLLINFRLKNNTYSNKFNLMDMNIYQKYVPDCDIVLDEFQSYFDSLDYKNFPKKIQKTFQFHRHFGIKDIYLLSQHPSRIVKQARILVNEFYNIKRFIKIPLIGIGIFRINIYYNYEDFGKSVNVKKEDVIYDFRKKLVFCRYKKVFKSYDTKYMKALVKDKPLTPLNTYSDLNLTEEDILNNFNMN